jgi:hypothetical protein
VFISVCVHIIRHVWEIIEDVSNNRMNAGFSLQSVCEASVSEKKQVRTICSQKISPICLKPLVIHVEFSIGQVGFPVYLRIYIYLYFYLFVCLFVCLFTHAHISNYIFQLFQCFQFLWYIIHSVFTNFSNLDVRQLFRRNVELAHAVG